MKKQLTMLVLATLFMSVATSVSAQRFGVKAGLNLANWTGDDIEDTKMLPTFMFGGVAEFDLGENGLGLGVGLQLHGKGAQADEGDGKATPFYLQVPVMLQYRNSGFFAGVGPYAGFGLFGKFKDGEDEDIEFGNSLEDDLSPLDFGLGLEVGYEFSGLRASASYNMGLANIFPKDAADEFDVSGKNAVIGIALAYLFGGAE